MREEKLNFGIIIRVFVSLLPILLGMPTLATIFCAYNLAMCFVVFGPITAFVSSLCSVCISMFLSGSYGPAAELSGLIWAIQSILCAAGCVYAVSSKKRFYTGLCLSTMGMLVPQFLYTQYQSHTEGMTVAEALVPSIEDITLMMNEMLAPMRSAGEFDMQLQNVFGGIMLDEVAAAVHRFTTMLIPSSLIISSMVLAYIVNWAVSAQLRRLPVERIHSFSHIKVSRIKAILVPVLFGLTVIGFAYSNLMLAVAALNMLIIFLSMCYFAGISLVDFYMRRFIRFNFMRVILHGIISLNLLPAYVLAGFVDSFANFRKLPVVYKERGEADETEKRNA